MTVLDAPRPGAVTMRFTLKAGRALATLAGRSTRTVRAPGGLSQAKSAAAATAPHASSSTGESLTTSDTVRATRKAIVTRRLRARSAIATSIASPATQRSPRAMTP